MTTKDAGLKRRSCFRCHAARAKVRGLCGACWSAETRRGVNDHSTLIVGMAPGDGTQHAGPAFVGSRSGTYLANLCGLDDRAELLPLRFTLVNLFVDEWQHGSGEAKLQADELKRHVIHRRFSTVIMCGRAVATAFGCKLGWFQWEDQDQIADGSTWSYRRAPIPHPSGLCRVWNSQAMRDEGQEFMTTLWKEA
jgi:hypothetical protein